MNKLTKVLIVITMFLAATIALAALLSYPTMLLWNWLMPVIFGQPTITFWQSAGLLALSSLLFKSTPSANIDI